MATYRSGQRATATQAAAIVRQQYLMKKAIGGVARLAIGDKAYQEGDIRVASRMFISVASARPVTPVNAMAKQRLKMLTEEAMTKIETVDSQLAAKAEQFATTEKLGTDGPLPDEWTLAVTTAFSEYEELRKTYDSVPAIRSELKSRHAKARRRPEYAAALQEQQASELCEVAHQHERDQQPCCAYWVYKEAATLAPAPSARLAVQQVTQMDQDEQLLAAAAKCKELKECHKLFKRAESVVATWPERALELLAQIVEKAPADSEIYRAARERMQELSNG